MKKKDCFKCGERLSLSSFYKHKGMADGRVNKCKDCNKSDVQKNRLKNREYYREYDRKRGNRQSQEYVKKSRSSGKIRYAAQSMVNNAIRDGRITKPKACESCCNEPKRLHGHHNDYAFPLSVRWLCPGCHSQWHKKNGEGLNAH